MLEFTNVQDSKSAVPSAESVQNGMQAASNAAAVASAQTSAASVSVAAPVSAPVADAQAVPAELNFDDELGELNPTKIKIIGCGGGGSSAVQRMIEDGVSGVDFIVLNTDKQALHRSTAKLRVPIGQKITGGLGAGGNPKVGEDAAIEDTERLKLVLSGANMVVITAGMGGGTGTGSAPVVAKLAHEAGILTIAVVTTPFEHEGVVRMNNAIEGLAKLRKNVDSLIVLPNDKIFKAMKSDSEKKLTFREQFILADNLLCAGVKGVTEIITKPGEINVDFADVCTIMRGSGESILGVGKGKGENRINEAVEGAIFNPLLENRQIDGAKKILINITSNGSISLEETREIINLIRHSADKNANIIFGLAINEEMEDDDLAVTVIATEFDSSDNDFISADGLNPAEEEKEDDNVVSTDDFQNILNGGLKTDPVESVPETIFGESDFKKPEPKTSAAAGRHSLFEQVGTFEQPPRKETPAVFADETSASPVHSFAEEKLPSERESINLKDDGRNTFRVKGLPAGVDANDPNVPSFYRNMMKDRFRNMGSSIDLTSE
ncbi:MAG: cell division protein FtsZ [Treponema sp.]|nr:cell division protein FtsZ [Spirochaetia bacterium]MDD7459704.1 cell division protein FtsZ [Spirochaetales bacterium]MDY5811696.1 cell division protein FtsZ [Treponema sp.]